MNKRHILALFKKDLKNSFVNKNVLIMIVLPPMFSFLFKTVYADLQSGADLTAMILVMSISMTLAIVPLNILAQIVAEEKEKHTLRSLFMANVTAAEFLIAKILVTLIIIIIDGVAIFFICNQSVSLLPYYLLYLILGSIGVLFFGAIVGLLSKDQMNAGTISSPLMILLMIPPMLSQFNAMMRTISIAFPTTSVQTLYLNTLANKPLFIQDNIIAFLVCIAWIVLGIIIFLYVYKRRGLDD